MYLLLYIYMYVTYVFVTSSFVQKVYVADYCTVGSILGQTGRCHPCILNWKNGRLSWAACDHSWHSSPTSTPSCRSNSTKRPLYSFLTALPSSCTTILSSDSTLPLASSWSNSYSVALSKIFPIFLFFFIRCSIVLFTLSTHHSALLLLKW